MLSDLDHFYLQQKEPVKSCLLALREIILAQDKDVSAAWKYRMPFFCYNGKMFCYVWFHKKYKQPYIGLVEGHLFNYPELIQEKRSRMKIFLVDPAEDLPLQFIKTILKEALDITRSLSLSK